MMHALDLNLASRPFRNNTLLWSSYAALLVLAVGFTSWNLVTYRNTAAALDELNRTEGDIVQETRDLADRERRVRAAVRAFDVKVLSTRASKANEVIEWKAFSWTRLFNRLGEVMPWGVRMTSVHPVFRGMQKSVDEGGDRHSIPVAIEGRARDYDSLWDLQNAILEDPNFGRLDPQRLRKEDNGEIAFELSFVYYPGVETEELQLAADEADEAPAPIAASGRAAAPTRSAADQDERIDTAGAPEPPRRKLPTATDEPEEVDDAWAATTPKRLPETEQEPGKDDDDDGGER